jgi:putative ABC transport system permease protein
MENVPDNSHIKFDILASLSTYPQMANNQFWISHNFYTYILTKDGTDAQKLQDKFQDMVITYVGPQLKEIIGQTIEDFRKAGNDFSYVLEPLKDIHLKGATQYNLEPPGSLSTVYIFGIIAILILVVAIINYVNLATAKSASRAKEVGVRKVSGANKSGLIVRFLSESLIITAVSMGLAILIVAGLMPLFNQMIDKSLTFDQLKNFSGIASILFLVVFIGIASGFYPAFVLASFNPAEVLKGTMNPGSMSKRLRWILVVFQFTVSIIIIIGSTIVYKQLNLLTKKDLGFEKENLVIVRRVDAFWQQLETFRTQLLEIPGVEKAGFSRSVPGTSFSNNAFFRDDDPEKNTYLINQAQVSLDFPEALGVQLKEGRYFSREYGTDSLAILINEEAVKSLGLKDPLNSYIQQPAGPQQWRKYKIIGVMKDFNIESMHKPIAPVCFTIDGGGGGDQFATIRLSGNNINSTISEIEKLWQKFTPDMPFQYDFFTDRWNNLYSSEMKTGKIFLIFSFLAIFIACMGLIGLITYITDRRTREIGIRKSYGASIPVILGLLSREMIYIILISSLLAYPVAYFGSLYWLNGFASKISLNPIIFILATLISMLIGWLSISYQTIKAANYNPATALRIE